MSQTILFFGNERLATGVSTTAPTLQALAQHYTVAAVVVAQQAASGNSRATRPLEIVEVARRLSIPVLVPAVLKEAEMQLKELGAEAAVLVAYGKIVPQSVIDLFPRGIVNIHPSLLPAHRGSTPIESAILNGDQETGVSLMQLSARMDAGPVYAQQKFAFQGTETKQQLADGLLNLGKDVLLEALPAILAGQAEPVTQNDDKATYDGRITKADGWLDFSKPARRLEREIRAYQGWPRSRAKLAATEVVITAAHVGEGSGAAGALCLQPKQLGVYAGDGILVIDRLIPSGKKEMSAAAFLAGYRPDQT